MRVRALLPLSRRHSCSSAVPWWLQAAARWGTACRRPRALDLDWCRPQGSPVPNPQLPGSVWVSCWPCWGEVCREGKEGGIRPLLALLPGTERSYNLHVPESRNNANPFSWRCITLLSLFVTAGPSDNTAPCFWKPVVCSGNWQTSSDYFTYTWSNTLSLSRYPRDGLVTV